MAMATTTMKKMEQSTLNTHSDFMPPKIPRLIKSSNTTATIAATATTIAATATAASSSETTTSTNTNTNTFIHPSLQPGCPLPVHQNIGVSTRNPLNNTLLVTAANIQFYPLLQNWEYYAQLHGYKWVVLCMDTKLYDLIGHTGRAILLPPDRQDGQIAHYRTRRYTKLVCSKVLMVVYLLQQCGSGSDPPAVLFSDTDLVIKRDFLPHDLGAMIRSGRYDYLYQDEFLRSPPRPRQMLCAGGGGGRTKRRKNFFGNTGFYFLRPTAGMVRVLQETLAQCEEDGQERNDQELFWNVMNEEIRSRRIQHCREYNNIINNNHNNIINNHTVAVNASEKKPEICCLDPYYYRTGQHKPENSSEPYIVHANFVSGMKNKTELLADFVDGWSLPPPYE